MKQETNKQQLVFKARVTDEEVNEWVKGGLALDLTDEEYVVMKRIMDKYNKITHRVGCADPEDPIHEDDSMESSLTDAYYWAFDLYVTDKDGEITSGVRGF